MLHSINDVKDDSHIGASMLQHIVDNKETVIQLLRLHFVGCAGSFCCGFSQLLNFSYNTPVRKMSLLKLTSTVKCTDEQTINL